MSILESCNLSSNLSISSMLSNLHTIFYIFLLFFKLFYYFLMSAGPIVVSSFFISYIHNLFSHSLDQFSKEFTNFVDVFNKPTFRFRNGILNQPINHCLRRASEVTCLIDPCHRLKGSGSNQLTCLPGTPSLFLLPSAYKHLSFCTALGAPF